MTTWNRNQGDHLDTLIVQLLNASSIDNADEFVPMDLTTVTLVEPFVYNPSQPTESRTFLTGTAYTNVGAGITLLDGLILVQLSPWLETADRGTWWLKYRLTGPGGSKITWPEGKADRIKVWLEGDEFT